MYLWKKSLSTFQDCWGQEVIFEVTETKFWISSIFDKFSFMISSFLVLKRFEQWSSFDLRDLRRVSGIFFSQNYISEICESQEKNMRHLSKIWSKFSLNLSTEEVWSIWHPNTIQMNKQTVNRKWNNSCSVMSNLLKML